MTSSQPSNPNPPEGDSPLFSCRIFHIVKKFQKGRSGQLHPRFVIHHPGGVGILPILPDGRVILIRQFRIAADRFLYEIPAGMKEPGEEPVETAKRELKEETGYSATQWTPLPSFYASPGYLTERIDLFAATGLVAGESALEDGEDLSLFIADQETIRRMIDNGEIEDAKTLVALLTLFNGTIPPVFPTQTP